MRLCVYSNTMLDVGMGDDLLRRDINVDFDMESENESRSSRI